MAKDEPDLSVFIHYDLRDIKKQIKSGAFTDTTPFLEADAEYIPKKYNQFIIECCQTDGKQYIMPTECSIPILLSIDEGKDEYENSSDLMRGLA